MNATKISVSRLNAKHLTNVLGLAWWDLAGADRQDRAWMRRDNASTIAALSGRRFYLIRRQHDHDAEGYTFLLCDEPGRTNLGHQPLVSGWLGTTDNLNHRAIGHYEVTGNSRTHLHLRAVE